MTTDTARVRNALKARLPREAWLVVGFEFLERFSFYSLLSLLVLFLTTPVVDGGFGWDRSSGLASIGLFSGLMYATPLAGGLIADRWAGHYRAIVIGGGLLFAGYAGLSLLTASIGTLHEQLGGALLWTALATIVAGNAFVKSTLVIVLGDTLRDRPGDREEAYTLYYTGINLGGLVAGIVSGGIVAMFGWQAAFLPSAIGLLAGLLLLPWLSVGRGAETTAKTVDEAVDSADTALRLGMLAMFAGFLLIYSIGSFQLYGTMMLVVENGINRRLGGLVLPAQWIVSVNSAALIVMAPTLAGLWRFLARRGHATDLFVRYATALSLGAMGLMAFGAVGWPSIGTSRLSWPLAAIAIFIQATGEVAAWTATYGMVYRLAPRRFVAVAMGSFYAATMGLGGYLAGVVGQAITVLGTSAFFLSLGSATAVFAVLLLLLRRTMLSDGRVVALGLR